MSTITKQWLQQTIADMEEHRDLFPGDLDDNHENVLAALRIALASLEAEPVAYADPQAFRNFQAGVARREWMWRNPGEDLIPVYTAPPAPIVPDEAISRAVDEVMATYAGSADECRNLVRKHIEDACRAAMLQGAEHVTTSYKLPANTPCNDAPEHIWLQTAGVWPENGEFSELTWCSDNQHKDDTLYVRADVVADNSPVIPDGWVACSERMPEGMQTVITSNGFDIGQAWWDGEGWNSFDSHDVVPGEVTHWMPLPAAPLQEVK